MTPSEALSELAKRYWHFVCEEQPLSAILAGEKSDAVALFREAPADYARRYEAAGAMLRELAAIPAAELSGQDRSTRTLLERELSDIRSQIDVDAHLRPWLLPAGPDFNTVFFANSTSLNSIGDAKLYVERLASLPAFLDQVRVNLQAGYDKGVRYPRVVLAGAARSARGMADAPAETSPWFGPIKRSTLAETADMRQLGERALVIIRQKIQPTMCAYADALEGPLSEGARDNLSCVDTPGGDEYYAYFAKLFSSSDQTPGDIHRLGIDEVARLELEIAQVAADAGFAGDVDGYRRFLAEDAQFAVGSKEELRASLESLCKRVDLKIPAFFKRIPRITYGVELMPEAIAASMPAGYAQPSPGDGSTAGVFWANSLVSKCRSYMHVPLVVHEAWPGHLMHIALMQEQKSLPAFRRHGAMKYTACVEGWALYCESLAIEMGLYETPHQHYGRLEMEMWRAVRLVVDTGIHAYGWGRDQAIDYMSARLTLDRASIEGEVDRYAALPGQALAYQIGNLKMRALRKRAEDVLGARFSHRTFHEAVMTAGGVTLQILEDVIEDWLARETAPAAA